MSSAITQFPDRVNQVISDISSFFSASECTEKSASNSVTKIDPWCYESFLRRVHTFKSSTWFAKPLWLSPVICSRYGWMNTDTDLLQCVGCKSLFIGRLPTGCSPDVYEACKQRLSNQLCKLAHHPCCPWPGNPTPVSVVQRNESSSTDHSDIVVRYLARVASLLKLNFDVPVIECSQLSISNKELDSLVDLVSSSGLIKQYKGESSDVFKSACMLALVGWEHKDNLASLLASCLQIECSVCSRSVGLWSYVTHKSEYSSESLTDQIEQIEQNSSDEDSSVDAARFSFDITASQEQNKGDPDGVVGDNTAAIGATDERQNADVDGLIVMEEHALRGEVQEMDFESEQLPSSSESSANCSSEHLVGSCEIQGVDICISMNFDNSELLQQNVVSSQKDLDIPKAVQEMRDEGAKYAGTDELQCKKSPTYVAEEICDASDEVDVHSGKGSVVCQYLDSTVGFICDSELKLVQISEKFDAEGIVNNKEGDGTVQTTCEHETDAPGSPEVLSSKSDGSPEKPRMNAPSSDDEEDNCSGTFNAGLREEIIISDSNSDESLVSGLSRGIEAESESESFESSSMSDQSIDRQGEACASINAGSSDEFEFEFETDDCNQQEGKEDHVQLDGENGTQSDQSLQQELIQIPIAVTCLTPSLSGNNAIFFPGDAIINTLDANYSKRFEMNASTDRCDDSKATNSVAPERTVREINDSPSLQTANESSNPTEQNSESSVSVNDQLQPRVQMTLNLVDLPSESNVQCSMLSASTFNDEIFTETFAESVASTDRVCHGQESIECAQQQHVESSCDDHIELRTNEEPTETTEVLRTERGVLCYQEPLVPGEQNQSPKAIVLPDGVPEREAGTVDVSLVHRKVTKRPATDDPNEIRRKWRRAVSSLRPRIKFDPVAEHQPWCSYVLSIVSEDVFSNSSQKPWLTLLKTLLPDPHPLSAMRSRLSLDALECIRYLFHSCTGT